MGLDMYAYRGDLKEGSLEEIAEWRKHNALHAWMENTFRDLTYEEYVSQMPWTEEFAVMSREEFKEFKQQSFNCIKLPLNKERIQKLREAVEGDGLKPTSGLFFGSTDYSARLDDGMTVAEWRKKEDLEFIEKAEKALEEGDVIIYDSWW